MKDTSNVYNAKDCVQFYLHDDACTYQNIHKVYVKTHAIACMYYTPARAHTHQHIHTQAHNHTGTQTCKMIQNPHTFSRDLNESYKRQSFKSHQKEVPRPDYHPNCVASSWRVQHIGYGDDSLSPPRTSRPPAFLCPGVSNLCESERVCMNARLRACAHVRSCLFVWIYIGTIILILL